MAPVGPVNRASGVEGAARELGGAGAHVAKVLSLEVPQVKATIEATNAETERRITEARLNEELKRKAIQDASHASSQAAVADAQRTFFNAQEDQVRQMTPKLVSAKVAERYRSQVEAFAAATSAEKMAYELAKSRSTAQLLRGLETGFDEPQAYARGGMTLAHGLEMALKDLWSGGGAEARRSRQPPKAVHPPFTTRP